MVNCQAHPGETLSSVETQKDTWPHSQRRSSEDQARSACVVPGAVKQPQPWVLCLNGRHELHVTTIQYIEISGHLKSFSLEINVSSNKELTKYVSSFCYPIKSLGGWLAHLVGFQC